MDVELPFDKPPDGGLCSMSGHPFPLFVGNDYFRESGINRAWDPNRHYFLHSGDVLWDGHNCLSGSRCCGLHNPPYFVRTLPTATADSIEARICNYFASGTADIAVQLMELYVK